MDHTRTLSYQKAISNSPHLFHDKLILDVGAGSGILSYFAVHAGAKTVYAVEASQMAAKITKLCQSNNLNNIIVLQEKIESPSSNIIPKVDTIISEPIGVLLVHERMLESYLIARDLYLKPGGTMIPSNGNIYLAPFSDASLWTQTMAKVRFWEQSNFYGVDLSSLSQDAKVEIFGQPIVGCFDARMLMAPPVSHNVDFLTISLHQLKSFQIPIAWTFAYTGLVHGVGGWFDIDLAGVTLCTAPSSDRTHWQQIRFLLQEPLAVNANEVILGYMNLQVNDNRSYDITVHLSDASGNPTRTRQAIWKLHEQTYHYDTGSVDLSKPEYNSMYHC